MPPTEKKLTEPEAQCSKVSAWLADHKKGVNPDSVKSTSLART